MGHTYKKVMCVVVMGCVGRAYEMVICVVVMG